MVFLGKLFFPDHSKHTYETDEIWRNLFDKAAQSVVKPMPVSLLSAKWILLDWKKP